MQRRIMYALATLIAVVGGAIVLVGVASAQVAPWPRPTTSPSCTIVQCPPRPEGPCGFTGQLCRTATTAPAKIPPQAPRRSW